MKKGFVYKRIGVGVLILLIGVGAFSYLLVMIQKRDAEAATLAADIQAQTIRDSRLRSLKRTVTGTDDVRQNLDKYFIPRDGIVGLVEDIESFGNTGAVEVDISSLRREPYEGVESFEWLVLSVSISGSWNSVVTTLAKLENLPYKTEMEDIVLSRGDAENSNIWSLRGILRVVKSK